MFQISSLVPFPAICPKTNTKFYIENPCTGVKEKEIKQVKLRFFWLFTGTMDPFAPKTELQKPVSTRFKVRLLGGRNLSKKALRPPRGLCEAHFRHAYKPCVIGALQSPLYIPMGL